MLLASNDVMPLVQLVVPHPSRPQVSAKPLLTTDPSLVNWMVIRPLVAVTLRLPEPQLLHSWVPLAMVPSHTLM